MKDAEVIVISLAAKTAPGPGGFTCEFYQVLKEIMLPVLHKVFQKIEGNISHLIERPKRI